MERGVLGAVAGEEFAIGVGEVEAVEKIDAGFDYGGVLIEGGVDATDFPIGPDVAGPIGVEDENAFGGRGGGAMCQGGCGEQT